MFSITISRRLAAVSLLLLTSAAAYAQKISMKGDVITVDKQPYAKLKKSGSMLSRDFTLTTLDDKEVMLAKNHFVSLPSNEQFIYYTLTFRPGGEEAEMSSSGLNFSQHLAEAIVQQGVMRDGQPDPEGIARFVKANSEKLSEKYAKEKDAQLNAPPLAYQTVQRSRQASFNLRGNQIMQDGKLIGRLNTSQTNGNEVDNIELPDGTLIAVVTISAWESGQTMTYKVLAKRNNVYHNRSANGGVSGCRQDALRFLISDNLL